MCNISDGCSVYGLWFNGVLRTCRDVTLQVAVCVQCRYEYSVRARGERRRRQRAAAAAAAARSCPGHAAPSLDADSWGVMYWNCFGFDWDSTLQPVRSASIVIRDSDEMQGSIDFMLRDNLTIKV